MGDTLLLQSFIETGIRECPPRSLRDDVIFRLLLKLRDEIGPIEQKFGQVERLLSAARRAAGNVDEHNGQGVAAVRVRQLDGVLDDFIDGVRGGKCNNALLQIDTCKRRLRVERGYCNGALLLASWTASRPELGAAKG